MSACILFILSQFSSFGKPIFDDFDYYRVHTHYNGSANNGGSILVYGDYGVITRSVDGGNTWTQTALPDSFNIVGLANIGYDYFGALDRNYAIKSTDNGKSFQMVDFGNYNFHKVLIYKENVCLLSENKVFVCNKDFDILKEYTAASDTSAMDAAIAGDILYYSSGKGKLTAINLANHNISQISLQNLGLCSNCAIPANFFSDGNTIYFSLDNSLYSFNGSAGTFIFEPDTTARFAANNGELYCIYTKTFTDMQLDSLYFMKINKSEKNAARINKAENDRYISYLNFQNLRFISKDTVVATGKDMLIYMSYDKGKTWILKSHLVSSYSMHIFDANNAIKIGSYIKFFKTTNGGVTWLPQKNYQLEYSDSRFKSYSQNTTLFKNKDIGFLYIYTITQEAINFAYTTDGGETIHLKNSNDMIGYNAESLPFSPVFHNEVLTFPLPAHLQGKWKFTLFYRLDEDYNVTSYKLMDSALVLCMDNLGTNDLYALVKYCKNPRYENGWVFDDTYLSFVKSSDNAETWETVKDLEFPDDINLDLYTINVKEMGDNLIISVYSEIDTSMHNFRLNVKTLQQDFVITRKYHYLTRIANVGKRVYAVMYQWGENGTEYQHFYNDNFEENPAKWTKYEDMSIDYGIYVNVYNDSLVHLQNITTEFN